MKIFPRFFSFWIILICCQCAYGQRWFGPIQDAKASIGYLALDEVEYTGVGLALEYTRVFNEPFVIGVQLTMAGGSVPEAPDYKDGLSFTSASLDLHLYYSLLKDIKHDLRFGIGGSGRFIDKNSRTTSVPDEAKLQLGYEAIGTYELSIDRNWTLGAKIFYQYYERRSTATFLGLLVGRKFD